jgi:hypothetical protein
VQPDITAFFATTVRIDALNVSPQVSPCSDVRQPPAGPLAGTTSSGLKVRAVGGKDSQIGRVVV